MRGYRLQFVGVSVAAAVLVLPVALATAQTSFGDGENQQDELEEMSAAELSERVVSLLEEVSELQSQLNMLHDGPEMPNTDTVERLDDIRETIQRDREARGTAGVEDIQSGVDGIVDWVFGTGSSITTTGQSGGPSAQPSGATTAGSCPSIGRSLTFGISGDDVSELQAYFAQYEDIYPEGIVSGYYGELTQEAVRRFQAREGIVMSGTPAGTGFGVVGPLTRGALTEVCTQTQHGQGR